jgi:hypothetical protein
MMRCAFHGLYSEKGRASYNVIRSRLFSWL